MARAHKTDCKGTTFFLNTQIFSEKNVFFLIKSMIILHSLYVHEVILTLKCVTLALLAVCNVILYSKMCNVCNVCNALKNKSKRYCTVCNASLL